MNKAEKKIKVIDKKLNIRQKLAGGHASPLKTYQSLTCGPESFPRFLIYELLTSVLGPLPGGAGFFLRKQLYPRLFKKFGRGVIIGRNTVFRHPHRISLGDNVTIDDNCLLDGRGAGPSGLVLENNVLINRNCMIIAKSGSIRFGRRTSIGSNAVIVSMDAVELGEAVLLAGGCYLSAGSYKIDALIPVMDQDVYTAGPIRIGDNTWLGTRVTVLDGVTIGKDAVIGACAMVNNDIPDKAVAVGTPAKVIRIRE
ncbi:acyltransferase [Desulfococcaceae bacterium HSG9]|nr:acyltransferase [Desulfococcaceae bacterium HSG9]